MMGVRTPAGVIYDGTTVPALCLDLDGTVRYSKSEPLGFIRGPEDVALIAGAEAKIWEYRDQGYLILGISNQGGVAHGYKTPQQAEAELRAMLELFERNPFQLIQQCFHDAAGTVFPYNRRSLLRKPDIGMLALMEVEAFHAGYLIDWDKSLFVGDRPEDSDCAGNAGIPFRNAEAFFGRGWAQEKKQK
jgi:D-glycero-D-manno-heptose 1,7-bisphosphate phosphatase